METIKFDDFINKKSRNIRQRKFAHVINGKFWGPAKIGLGFDEIK